MLTYYVFIFFLLIILYALLRKMWMAGIYIVAMYALSAFGSIFLLQEDSSFKEPTLFPTILYCSLLFITFLPFLRKRPGIYGFRSNLEQKRFLIAGYALSIPVIIAMIYILPKIFTVVDYGLVETRTAIYHGDSVAAEEQGIIGKIFYLFLGYFGGLWYIYIIWFFYSLVFIPRKFIFKTLLIIASLSQVELGLTLGGRTNAIYWLQSFLFTLIFFYSYLNKRTKKIVITASVVTMSVVFVYVAFVTIQRSLLREGGTSGFLLEYVGQPYLYFCEFFDNMEWHPYTLERIFPFSSYLLKTGFNLEDFRFLIESHTGLDIGIFYTFMGDIFVDLGMLGVISFVLIYYVFARRVLSTESFGIKNLCYVAVVYALPLHGLFYYSFWKSGDFVVVAAILLGKYISTGFQTEEVQYS